MPRRSLRSPGSRRSFRCAVEPQRRSCTTASASCASAGCGQHFPRIAQVEAIDGRASVPALGTLLRRCLRARGGFDLVLGNPPWIKVEWNEAGMLGEANPLFAIRKLSATELAKLAREAFAEFPGLQDAWTSELEEAEGHAELSQRGQNYPLLKGVQTNLYKCFLPVAGD